METMEQTGCDLILFGQKTAEKPCAAGLEVSTAVGKDEVGSSNLPSSSKKHRKLLFSMLFCCKNAENGVSQNVGKPPDPHRDPHAKMCG